MPSLEICLTVLGPGVSNAGHGAAREYASILFLAGQYHTKRNFHTPSDQTTFRSSIQYPLYSYTGSKRFVSVEHVSLIQ